MNKETTKETAVEAKKEVKKTAKKPAVLAKTVSKKVDAVTELSLQYVGNDVSMSALAEKVKQTIFESGYDMKEIVSLKIYIKPEDGAAYYVVNDEVDGKIELF